MVLLKIDYVFHILKLIQEIVVNKYLNCHKLNIRPTYRICQSNSCRLKFKGPGRVNLCSLSLSKGRGGFHASQW